MNRLKFQLSQINTGSNIEFHHIILSDNINQGLKAVNGRLQTVNKNQKTVTKAMLNNDWILQTRIRP